MGQNYKLLPVLAVALILTGCSTTEEMTASETADTSATMIAMEMYTEQVEALVKQRESLTREIDLLQAQVELLQDRTEMISQQVESGVARMEMQNRIQIRGNATAQARAPLYIIDGAVVDTIDNLSPGDIQSMEILKDAAAAAKYGARGANGVVLITTQGE